MSVRRFGVTVQSFALLAIPSVLLLVGAMHFRHPQDFLDFRAHYVAPSAEDTVRRLVARGTSRPLLHDPHVLAYFALPLVPAGALGLYNLGKKARPLASALALGVTLVGSVYLGGLFGMWTAFFSGIAGVDPSQVEGAVATFAALTAPRGAFLLTTMLAKLGIVGLLLQAASLVHRSIRPAWAPPLAVLGCTLVLAFWDQDNSMMIGEALFLAGMWPLRASLSLSCSAS